MNSFAPTCCGRFPMIFAHLLPRFPGNASNLLTNESTFDEATRHQIYADIYDDPLWLINLVENLLSVTRINKGKSSYI